MPRRSKSKPSPRAKQLRKLHKDEVGLRKEVEKVAVRRRALPPGEPVKDDYVLVDSKGRKNVRLSQLFGPKRNELLVYHYMWAPDDAKPCPMCTMWCDGYDAVEPYVRKRVNFVLVAKAPPEKLAKWARGRGWKNIRLLSSFGSKFNRDMKVEDRAGGQYPVLSVFTKDRNGTIRRFYHKSAILGPSTNRGIDLMSPVWNLFDMLPSGRGEWLPNYER